MAREARRLADLLRSFVSSVLATATEARKAWIDLAFVDESIRLGEAASGSLEESGLSLRQLRHRTGMITLEGSPAANDIAKYGQKSIPWRPPHRAAPDSSPRWAGATEAIQRGHRQRSCHDAAQRGRTLARAQTSNPELGQMRAMVEMTLASVEVARKAARRLLFGAMVNLIDTAADLG